MIKTAVVILNWNGEKFLKQFLGDVLQKTSSDNCRVYVADNGSTDGSLEFIKNNYPDTGLIRLDNNLGFAAGYNAALEGLEAEYFVLLNSDIEVSDHWLESVIEYLDTNKDVAACQPKILNYNKRDHFEYAGAAGGFIDKYGYPFCRGRILNHTEEDNGKYDNKEEIFWASGACMFIRSTIWKECGGFDADFFAHMEEIDLCWRIHSLGHKIVFIPESSVYHIGGGTLAYNSPSKILYNFRNNLYLLHKNLPEKHFKRRIFTRMILDGIAGLRFLALFQFKAFIMIWKAHIQYYGHIKTLNKKRKYNLSRTIEYPGKLIYNKSIIYNYYLRRKRIFTEIWDNK